MHSSQIDLSLNEIILSDEVAELITVPELVGLLESACNLANLADYMKKMTGNSPLISPVLIPFMSSVSDVILNSHQQSISTALEHEKRLNDLINSWKLQRHPVSGDGNCFFSAVAYALETNDKSILQNDKDFFTSKDLNIGDAINVGHKLRELTVAEWKNNEEYYQSFLVSSNVRDEAEKFLKNGYYHGELADTMVLALSNALQVAIVVLSSISNHPVIHIVPQHIANPVTLFLAYNQYGPGHYDGLVIKESSSEVTTVATVASNKICTCGKSDKTKNTHCYPKTRKYTTVCFCPCYNDKKGCSDHCKCKSCENPHGKRGLIESPLKKKRRRHEWQIATQRSSTFALKEGETLNFG